VLFGEAINPKCIERIDKWIEGGKVDLMLVIGTCAKVYPAAGYVAKARKSGAKIAVVNLEAEDDEYAGEQKTDWYFQGDAAVLVPDILEVVVGKVSESNMEVKGLDVETVDGLKV
jgi:NAD-dependent SIR2 family protein deacetylase